MKSIDWLCPECYEINDGELMRCVCGHDYTGDEATIKEEYTTEAADSTEPGSALAETDRILALVADNGNRRSWKKNIIVLVLSLALFFMWGVMSWNLTTLLALIISIFVHELGHIWAMKLTGHKNLQMLFIPFMGGIAAGEAKEEDAANNAMIAIAGPLTGMISAALSAFFFNLTGKEFFSVYAELTVILSVINLLPIYPLDGGRFFNDLFLYRNSKVELLFRVFAAGLFLFGAAKLADGVLLTIGILVLLPLKANMAVTAITKEFIEQYGPKKSMDAGVVEFLRKKIVQRLPVMEGPGKKEKAIATYIKQITKKAATKHATAKRIFVLVSLYIFTLVILPVAVIISMPYIK